MLAHDPARAAKLGMRAKFGAIPSAPGITAYLEAGGTLENAQAMARARKSAYH